MTGVGGDTGRGLRVAARGFRTWFRFGWWIAVGIILAGLAAAIWKTTSDYTGHDWHVIGVYALCEFMLVADFKPGKTKKIRDLDGTVLVMTLDTITKHPGILDLRERLLGDVVDAALLGGGACAGLAVVALFGLHLLGRRLGQGRRLRGGELESARELRRRAMPLRQRALLRFRPPEVRPYTIAGIPWARDAETLHTIVSGTTGSGKTVLIADLVEQIRKRGERCVVLRQDGLIHRDLLRPGPGRPAQPARRPRAALVAFPRGPHRARFRHHGGRPHPPPEGRSGSLLDHRGTPALLSRRRRALAAGRDPEPGAGGSPAQDRAERARGGHGGHRDTVHRRSRQPQDRTLGARHAYRQHRRYGTAARRG